MKNIEETLEELKNNSHLVESPVELYKAKTKQMEKGRLVNILGYAAVSLLSFVAGSFYQSYRQRKRKEYQR